MDMPRPNQLYPHATLPPSHHSHHPLSPLFPDRNAGRPVLRPFQQRKRAKTKGKEHFRKGEGRPSRPAAVDVSIWSRRTIFHGRVDCWRE